MALRLGLSLGLLAAAACQLPPGRPIDRSPDAAERDDGSVADIPSVEAGGDGDGDGDGSAGTAPDNLRVGDRVRPLNVEGAPLFSWLPRDAAGDQMQTAYQIRVRLESSGADVWDSGQVMSSEQAYVAYGGPALTPDESYTWTVRTWNRGDVASPWSARADFDTGLADGAAGWGASWIRRAVSGADATDEYTLARVEKTLDAKPIRRARAPLQRPGLHEARGAQRYG